MTRHVGKYQFSQIWYHTSRCLSSHVIIVRLWPISWRFLISANMDDRVVLSAWGVQTAMLMFVVVVPRVGESRMPGLSLIIATHYRKATATHEAVQSDRIDFFSVADIAIESDRKTTVNSVISQI